MAYLWAQVAHVLQMTLLIVAPPPQLQLHCERGSVLSVTLLCVGLTEKSSLTVERRERAAMCSLRQWRYGLSCGRRSRGASARRTLFHVKLTDAAIKALQVHRNLKVPSKLFQTLCDWCWTVARLLWVHFYQQCWSPGETGVNEWMSEWIQLYGQSRLPQSFMRALSHAQA